MSSDTTPAESVRVDAGSAGLSYVSDENLGISRQKRAPAFVMLELVAP